MLRGHADTVRSAKFSPDGHILATAGFEDESAGVWEVPTGRQLFRLKHEGVAESLPRAFRKGGVRFLRFDPSARNLATGGQDGTVRLWNLEDGRESRRFKQRGYARDVRFTPDGQYIIMDSESDVGVWSLSTGERVATIDKLASNDQFMSVLGISPDGGLLLLTSFKEKSVQVREIPDLQIVARLLHEDDVFSGVFNRDSSRLLTASRDKTSRIWNTHTWQEITRVVANDFMYSALYSPDEKFFVTASGDGFAQVWAAELDAMIGVACQRLRRNLTREEWRQYFGSKKSAETCPR